MKLSKFHIRITILLLAAALVVVSANAQESTKEKSETNHLKDTDSLENAIALLMPPDQATDTLDKKAIEAGAAAAVAADQAEAEQK